MNLNDDELRILLSAALDEVYRLRKAMAYEARVLEAHYEGYKTFPKSRRPYAEEQVERMRDAARGDAAAAYSGENWSAMRRELRNCGASETLTLQQWIDEATP